MPGGSYYNTHDKDGKKKDGRSLGSGGSAPAPVSGGGGLAESYQESSGGSSSAAAQTVATNSTGYKPATPTAKAPAYAAPTPISTGTGTTVNLKPLISTITDPATRSLASSAISNGLRYEVNPSVLLAAASVTDYGRKGQGKGYTNLGDGSEDGAKSIKQAAKYLSEAGFHKDPDGALKALAKTTGNDPAKIRETASGYTALDEAARKVEEAPGDTKVKGVGRFKYRKPEDRPSAKTLRAAAAGVAGAGVAAARTAGDWGTPDAIAVANGQKALGAEQLTAAQDAAALGKTAAAAQGILPGSKQSGPRPRKVANRLEKAANKTGSMQQYADLGPDAPELAAAAVKYGKQYGIPPSVLFNQLGIESGWGADITGPPTPYGPAQGWAQFIKSTRDQVLKETGIDAWKSPADAVHAQAYLLNQAGFKDDPHGAVFSYNHSDAYVSDVLDGAAQYKELDGATAKSVPKRLVNRATEVLGKEATKAILAGGKLVKAPKGGSGPIPMRVLKQHIIFTEPKSEVRAEQGAPARTSITGMSPELQQALVTLSQNTGIPVRINEGYRTEKRANEFPSGTASQHHQGNAADVDNNADYSAEDLAAAGLTNTAVDGEPWHFQPTNPGEGGKVAPAGIPIKGTNLVVLPPATGASSGTGTTSGGVGAELQGALNAAGAGSGSGSRATRAAAAPGMTIQSAAAAYARKSLQGGDTGDPLYDAFRPSR